ncbi:amidase [Hoeflea sp. CAU 1731]
MADFSDYRDHDGLGLADLVRRGEISQHELLEAAIDRAEHVNPAINALSQKLYALGEIMAEDLSADAPFAGVPFLLKDASAMLSGTVTTQGAKLFADNMAKTDTTLVERYKRAGVIIFGKTTTPEMALAASTESTFCGTTRNPWRLDRTAGGSSGGAAAAVAAGIVPIAHASDGGGSIRIPASCCGLFGLKPSRARTPNGPLAGEGWGSLSASHVVTRSVRDSAAMLDATHGPAPGDPYCAPHYGGCFLDEVTTSPGRLKIAFQRTPLSGAAVDPECARAAEDAASLLEQLGHTVIDEQPPGDWEELGHALWVLVASNVSRAVRKRAAELGREIKPEDVDRATWSAVEYSSTLPVEAYPEALARIHMQGRRMAEFHMRHDVVMSPTLARAPVPLGVQHTNNPDQAAYVADLQGFTPFTQLFNLTGQPSMSAPLHWTSDGLPVGVMFSAAFGDEATLLRLAGQLEEAKPWFSKTPGEIS